MPLLLAIPENPHRLLIFLGVGGAVRMLVGWPFQEHQYIHLQKAELAAAASIGVLLQCQLHCDGELGCEEMISV